jgi:choline kinase
MINLSNTDIVLLSAGMGKRLGKIGTIKPKSLIKINNETLLTRLVKILVLRKATKISVMVGYKSQKIKQELRKIKEVKFKFIKVKNYKTHGHSYTWYLFNKFWNKKKNILLLHTDIIFNENILDNILRSNTKNIIGIKSKKQHLLNPNSFVVQADYKSKIKKIDHLKNLQKYAGEIIGINKISIGTMKLFFKFMEKKFRKKDNRYLSWEYVMNMFINETKVKLFILHNQTTEWVNINRVSDLKRAKKLFKI